MSVVMPGAWRCELHRLWTTGDCPDCDADLIATHEAPCSNEQWAAENGESVEWARTMWWCDCPKCARSSVDA